MIPVCTVRGAVFTKNDGGVTGLYMAKRFQPA